MKDRIGDSLKAKYLSPLGNVIILKGRQHSFRLTHRRNLIEVKGFLFDDRGRVITNKKEVKMCLGDFDAGAFRIVKIVLIEKRIFL